MLNVKHIASVRAYGKESVRVRNRIKNEKTKPKWKREKTATKLLMRRRGRVHLCTSVQRMRKRSRFSLRFLLLKMERVGWSYPINRTTAISSFESTRQRARTHRTSIEHKYSTPFLFRLAFAWLFFLSRSSAKFNRKCALPAIWPQTKSIAIERIFCL